MEFLNSITSGDKVLIAPLNWGLGHATRCIPIINYFLDQDIPIVIASDGIALNLLRREFPEVTCCDLAGYKVAYRHKSMFMNMLRSAASVQKAINEEFTETQKIVTQHDISVIISDNRYGVRTNHTQNYFICHQIGIQTGNLLFDNLARKWHLKMINRFDHCWIPDDREDRLAGVMSAAEGLKSASYIGTLSRLELQAHVKTKYDVLVVLSGPEPQRTNLEKLIIEVLNETPYRCGLIRGVDEDEEDLGLASNIKLHHLEESTGVNELICSSRLVICRSGYSSIMDLERISHPAIIIPTPGQTEQEYLADYLKEHRLFYPLKQKRIKSQLAEKLKELL